MTDASRNLHYQAQLRPLSRKELILFFLFATLLWLSRMPDRLVGFLWAEDGVVFIEQAYQMGWHSIFHPYAGYLHLLPRLITWVYSFFGNPKFIPKAYVLISIILSASSVTYIVAIVSKYLPRFAAFFIAITPFIIMHNGEVWLNITNLQWVTAPLLAVLLWEMSLKDEVSKTSFKFSILKSSILIILMMTGPFGIILGTFAIVAAIIRKIEGFPWPNKNLLISFLFGFFAHAVKAFHWPIPQPIPSGEICKIHNFKIIDWIRAFFDFILADFLGISRITPTPMLVWILCSIIFIVLLFSIVFFAEKKWKSVILALMAISFLFWALSGFRTNDPFLIVKIKGTRYSYLPIIFISWTLIIGMTVSQKRWIRTFALAIIGIIILNGAFAWNCNKWPKTKIKEIETGRYRISHMSPTSDWNVTFTDFRLQKMANGNSSALSKKEKFTNSSFQDDD